jgi:hypothetical protein
MFYCAYGKFYFCVMAGRPSYDPSVGGSLPFGGFDTSSTTEAWLSVSHRWWFRQAQPPRRGFLFRTDGGFDKLNHRGVAFCFAPMVVSTGSTTEAHTYKPVSLRLRQILLLRHGSAAEL